MGKKRYRKAYTSKGARPNVSNKTLRLMRDEGNDMLNKIAAWKKGKRGYITVANPNKQETNRRFIKMTFEQFFRGTYKDVMTRNKTNTDNDKVEIK